MKNNINLLIKISKLQLKALYINLKKLIISKQKSIQLLNIILDYYSGSYNKIQNDIKKGMMSLIWKKNNNFLYSIKKNINILKKNLLIYEKEINANILIWNTYNKKYKIWKIYNKKILLLNLKKKKILDKITLNEYYRIYFLNQKK